MLTSTFVISWDLQRLAKHELHSRVAVLFLPHSLCQEHKVNLAMDTELDIVLFFFLVVVMKEIFVLFPSYSNHTVPCLVLRGKASASL